MFISLKVLDLSNLPRPNKCHIKIYAHLHGNKTGQTTLPDNKVYEGNVTLRLEIHSASSLQEYNL